MQAGSYCGSSNGERASERQRRLAVNQFGPRAHRRFESCRSHCHKRNGGIRMPPSPNWSGTGLLSRSESVRVRPAAMIALAKASLLATAVAGGFGNPPRVPETVERRGQKL